MPKIVKITNLTDKEKEEWEKKLKANNTSVNLPTAKKNVDTINNQSTVRGNLPIKIANTNELENAKILSSNDIKAMEEAKRINKEIEKGGINATNAIIGNTLNSFSGGVQRGTAGIANAGMLPVAWALRKVDDIGQKLGVIPEENSIRNASDRILKESDRLASIGNYNSNINARLDNKGAQVIGNTFNTVGNMMPSIVANIVAPGSGTGILGISAGGSSAQENLNYNKSNQGRSIITGVLKGGLEALTEQITGGNAITQTGGLDRFVVPGISRVKSKVLQRLLSKGYEFAGEILEEEVSDIGGYIIDKWINNKKMPGFKEAWENAGETAGMTFLSTALLNAFGLGGNTYNDVQEYMNNKQAKQWLDEATKQIKEEKLDKKIEEDINAKLESRNKVLPIDEVIRQNNPNIQEANQENNYKLSLLEEINSSKMSNEEKMQMLELVENSNINEDTYNDIRETINQTNSLIEQQTIAQENKKAQNDNIMPMNTKQKYMKYKNDTNTYDATVVNEVLDITPTNRNGKRTVKQWLQVANEIGTRLADKSDAEIERIAYKSWFDTQPTKSITRYDNQAKTNLPFIKLTADEWVDTISKAANEARSKTQNNVSQANIVTSDDNLITSAKKKNLNFNDISIQSIQQVMDKAGIKSRFDIVNEFIGEDGKINKNVGSVWKLTQNPDGTHTREIIFNPEASEKTIIQEMAVHEMFHDIFAKKDKSLKNRIKVSQDLYDNLSRYLEKDAEYNRQLQNLRDQYKGVYNEEVDQFIKEEAIAKTLQTKFGTQEEINRLVHYEPTVARRFYDWVVDKLNKLTGSKVERLFWEDVRNKFERAYSEEGNYDKQNNIKQDIITVGKMQNWQKNRRYSISELKGSSGKTTSDRISSINIIPSSNENVNTTKYSINNTDSFNLPENVKDIKNMNEFLRKAISEETDSTWRERLKDAQSSGYSRIMKESPLQYKRQIVQQYLNYKMDSQGRVLSQEQQKYFKDSKARDDSGKLETVYHGSNKAGFTDFNRNYNYFTNNKEVAQSYTRGTEMVDTRRLESISDAKSWLKGITDEAYIENNKVYDEYGEEILSYNTPDDLLKNLKKDIQKEFGDIEAGGTYEGYVNITNPVIVDAKGNRWSMIDVDGISIDGIEDVGGFLNDYGSSTWKEKGKLRTSTNDIVEAVMSAIEDGKINADGIIIKNVYDEGGYGNVTPTESGTDYITFNSNQFKAIDNKAPTSDADIRYSINTAGEMQDSKGNKVTLDGETGSSDKTLLAIHNLNEEKLRGVLELGGFPVPSIAITNPDIVNHSQFGDISVIFNKDTINPEVDSRNEVYDRDVWSPTFPQVDYEINEKGLKNVANKLGIESWKLKDYAEDSSKPEYLVDKLFREEKIVDNYIKDNNLKYETAYKDADTNFTIHNGDKLRQFIIDNDFDFKKLYKNEKLQQEYFDLIKDYYDNADLPPNLKEKLYNDKIVDLKDYIDFQKGAGDLEPVRQLIKYQKDFDLIKSGETKVVDEWQTNKNKKEVAEKNGIKDYLQQQIKEVYGDKGIYNGKEYITENGRRTFWQLHDEYNLDNIVDALTKQDTKGTQNWIAGYGQIQAKMANQFNSIQDIKANENLLTNLSEENNILTEARNNIEEDIDEIVDKNDTDIFIVSELLADFASGDLTVENFKKLTNNYYQSSKNVSDNLIKKIIKDLKTLKNMPTDYFEAKPQRAVGFDEIDAIVIPSDLDNSLKQELKDRGIKIIEYDSNSETERADILKSLNEYKFSKETSFDDYISKRIGKEGTRTRFADLKLPKQENTSSNIKLPITKMAMNTKEGDLGKIAEILNTPVQQQKPQQRVAAILKANLIDKGAVFEDISKKINNRELEAKWDSTLSSGAKGQYAIGNDRYEFNNGEKTRVSKSLESIIEEVGDKESEFQNYMYHQLNVDRMTLDKRFGIDNKPVFGKNVGAEYSRQMIQEYEKNNPEFKRYAQDVYDYLNANKQELVNSGVISEELSEHLAERYPHYVPIKRVGVNGNAIAVPLDTRRTGINAPLKKAKGGSQDIQPLFNTIADRTLQTYRASARNSFGVELKNSLDELNMLNNTSENVDIDDIIDTMADEEKNSELLKKGEKGQNPTFTVFENGNKITYDISEDMYDALKPKNELYTKFDNSKLGKAIQGISSFRRGLITEYNPIFSLTNAVKDAQDVLLNSQHAAKTYAKLPEAYAQILGKGYYYQEYMQNGGEQNSYFKDGDFEIKRKNTLPTKAANILKIPIEAISKVNNVIEMSPRLAEYIASRESGRSVETSMLDAARVTTNFKAGGDLTRFANRNGFTFLNAGVQGLEQNIRNIREAHQKGLKGYAVLATKMAIAGLPALLLNGLIWKDDDDYEDLQDYVKDNYYIIGKYGKGQFIRIPKGRVVSVIQKVLRNADEFINNKNKIDADEYASQFWKDLKEDVIFGIDNIAPNNPIENNILSPLFQAITNKTWYGGDLVPTRLQDKPAGEQYDETTDKFSKWLGGKIGVSPIKINYLLDQYTGGIGDVLLPMGTPQAENNAIEDKFTTNSVMKSKYPGEFFEKFDELNIKHNSEKATDEDQIKYKYFSTLRGDLSGLYKQKRDIQNSTMSDKEKKEKLLEVQKQINDIAKEGLSEVKNIKISGNTATAGKEQYYRATNTKDGTTEWKKLTDEEVKKNKDISLKTYANYKEKVANETIKQRKAGTIDTNGSIKDRDQIQILVNSNYSNKEKAAIYENYINSKDSTFNIMQNTGININEYLKYKIQNFESDKQDDGTTTGKSVSGSKKAKVYDYVNKMNINYNQRLVLLGTQYKLSDTERTKLAQYVNNLKTSKANKLSIYEKLQGFTVYKDGRVTW